MEADSKVARLAALQHGVVADRQIRALGIERHTALRRVRTGRWERVAARVLRMAGAPATPEQRAMVAVLDAGPDAVLSHEAAAWAWRLPGFGPCDVVLRDRPRNHAPTEGAGHRPVLVLPHHRTVVRDLPCTSLPRTIFDLAGICSLEGRMPNLVNSVVTRSPAMLPALHRTLDELAKRGRPGIRVMRQILDDWPLGSRLPASGLEARVLQLARNAGIHDLEPQVDVGGHSWLGRVDFAILRLGLLIEVDSVVHHSSPLDTTRDELRDAAMLTAGWRKVLRITEEDVWRRPWLVVAQLRAAIRELERFSA
jgi:very-short-patch-repair endonuclease